MYRAECVREEDLKRVPITMSVHHNHNQHRHRYLAMPILTCLLGLCVLSNRAHLLTADTNQHANEHHQVATGHHEHQHQHEHQNQQTDTDSNNSPQEYTLQRALIQLSGNNQGESM